MQISMELHTNEERRMRENCLRDTIHSIHMCDFGTMVVENPSKKSHFGHKSGKFLSYIGLQTV